MSTCKAPSLLLNLPKELQLTIWEYVLIEPEPIPFFEVQSIAVSDNPVQACPLQHRLRWTVPALLQTCHSARVEGIRIFYSNNTFVLQQGVPLGPYEEIKTLFQKSWDRLLYVKHFGVEYKLPSTTVFLLLGHRKLTQDKYTFLFEYDAAPSQQRPLAALEFWETDVCLCVIEASIQKRHYSALADYTKAMVAFLASFGEMISNNELRVLRHCANCGKRMLEQKPRSLT